MNYIKTYESFGNDDSELPNILEKLSKKVDTKKLYFMLKPYKKILRKLYFKYSTNGIINTSLIENDINKSVESISEGFGDTILSKLVNILKLPLRLLKNLYDFITEMWSDGTSGKFIVIFIAFFTFFLGFMFYQIGEHAINGITIGIASETEFVPEHYETRVHTYKDKYGTHTYTTREFVPDTWKAEVRATNGRVEKWHTTDRASGTSIHDEDVIRKTDKWDWDATTSYGDEQVGDFSGGGTSASF